MVMKINKIIALLTAVFCLFGVCGCGSSLTESGNENTATKITLSSSEVRLNVGESQKIDIAENLDEVVWVSSLENIVYVSQEGVVSGLNEGTASITAISNGMVASCTVIVTKPEISDLTLTKYSLSIKEGEYSTIYATSQKDLPIAWASEDSSVATVNGGLIFGLKAGTTKIYAWTVSETLSCTVTVTTPDVSDKDGYDLVWSDEFEGTSLDTTKWCYMTGVQDNYGTSYGPMYWGNNEEEYYTENAVTVEDGNLKITATREDMPNGMTYSSGRIATRDRASWTYGYFEARMKLPAVAGMWPAFWMLPQPTSTDKTDNQYGWWASNGEIDIIEAKGRLPEYANFTLHYGNYGSSTYNSSTAVVSGGIDSWHIYALEWTESYIAWLLDGREVFKVSSDKWWSEAAPDSNTAPFDTNFYILLNLAVGGNYDGGVSPDESFVSDSMLVDYVRVYSKTSKS
jgi:beta-glucanase (GH16 family)